MRKMPNKLDALVGLIVSDRERSAAAIAHFVHWTRMS